MNSINVMYLPNLFTVFFALPDLSVTYGNGGRNMENVD